MADQVQLRRGTTAQHTTFTGSEGEITYDTDKKTVVVHDGLTVGGIPLALTIGNKGLSNVWYYMAAGNYTWTKTGKTGLKSVRVFVHGSGGAGSSGFDATDSGGGGGGAGGAAIRTISADLLETNVSITVGLGATSAQYTAAFTPTRTGNTSSFGTWVSATGGVGGSAAIAFGAGGVGGSGVNGDINITGASGGSCGGTNSFGNAGGNGSILNTSGGVPNFGSSSPTSLQNGTFGSGGAGGYGSTGTQRLGGNGGDGFVIVEEFYI